MMSLAYYRERAERCRVFAAKSRSYRLAASLLSLAAEFDRKADGFEARKVRPAPDKKPPLEPTTTA